VVVVVRVVGLIREVDFRPWGTETSICIVIVAAIFVHSIPSGNRGIGMSLFERKGQLMLLFGSYSRKSKKSKKNCMGMVAKRYLYTERPSRKLDFLGAGSYKII
jgi:hypothetical protein